VSVPEEVRELVRSAAARRGVTVTEFAACDWCVWLEAVNAEAISELKDSKGGTP
jgi:hypothetical protein